MNPFIKKILSNFNVKYKLEIVRQGSYFDKPAVLKLLKKTVVTVINDYIQDVDYNQLINKLRKDKNAKIILKFISQSNDKEILNDILLECSMHEDDDITFKDIPEDVSVDNIFDYAHKNNDLISKIDINKYISLSRQVGNVTEMIGTYTVLLYNIIYMIYDNFTKTEHPSSYRTNYTQLHIRHVFGLLKTQYKELESRLVNEASDLYDAVNVDVKNEINDLRSLPNQLFGAGTDIATKSIEQVASELNKIAKTLEQLDDFLIAMSIATTLYMSNRYLAQKQSRKALKEKSKEITCAELPEPEDVVITPRPLNLDPYQVECLLPDNVLVPHTPYALKAENISCELPDITPLETEITLRNSLDTMAVIRNKKKEEFISQVKEGWQVTQKTVLGNIGNEAVYSPIEGVVKKVLKNEIVIDDIVDAEQSYLESLIESLSSKYEYLNNIKAFLKEHYIRLLYPIMLSISIVDDKKTYDVQSGIDKVLKELKKQFDTIEKRYDKEVKRITGASNVEKHAKNETLHEIKDDIEKEVERFYSRLKLIGAAAQNEAKVTTAKSNEHELLEYYLLKIGGKLFSQESLSGPESTLANKVKEYIQRRIIVEEYKREKIEKKLNELLKDLEKGLTTGNWFKKIIDVYTPKRSLEDVKKWLTGLATLNKKLNVTEKEEAVNRILFIFELWLKYDEHVKKNNDLKKETTPKNETINEGNELKKFIDDLWVDYESLGDEIEELETTIKSLSQLQSYSIIEYEGFEARLYSLADIPKCKIDNDDYKPSSIGYNDIRYWLKYCSFATLASVTNPAIGWATGIIIPAPIMLPVVYIPVSVVPTNYGFITIGVSICGMWVFPWVLMSNLSANSVIPFGDPTGMLKRQIQELKNNISKQSKNTVKKLLKKEMDSTSKHIDDKNKEHKVILEALDKNKKNKPVKIKKEEKVDLKTGVKENLNYAYELSEWLEEKTELEKQSLVQKVEIWKLSTKWSILNKSYTLGVPISENINNEVIKAQETLTSQLNKLDTLVDTLDSTIASLPIALKPNTANFGLTLKNTKPIIKIAGDFDNNINTIPLEKLMTTYNIKSDEMMTPGFRNRLLTSTMNKTVFEPALKAIKTTTVIKDPFPKYEELSPINLPWVAFLYKDFVKVGAQSYGFPGQLPLPV